MRARTNTDSSPPGGAEKKPVERERELKRLFLGSVNWQIERKVELYPAMTTPNRDSSMQQLAPVAPPRKASGSDTGKELVVVDPAGKGSGGVKLREDEEVLEVKLRRIMDNVPVRVSNTSGSSAGSGSGDFHQYRQMRRREQDRLARMDADYQKRREMAEFELRREERLKAAEERTAKKRLKRQKKQRKKEKRTKTSNGGEEPNRVESSDDEGSDDDDKSREPDDEAAVK